MNSDNAEQYAESEYEGLYDKSKRRGIFLQVFDGSICQKSKEVPTEEGWEHDPIKTMNPHDKSDVYTYVKRYDRVIARIVDVNKRSVEFNKKKITNWNFTLMAGTKRYTLQATYMDLFLQKFLKVAPNIDFNRPVLMSAFKTKRNGEEKQIVSIRQGQGDPDNWVAVPYYWEHPVGQDKRPDFDKEATGADGSVLPGPIVEYDEEEDKKTWNFKGQNKFLASYFRENTLPKVKAIAERLGLTNDMVVDDEGPAFTGPPQKEIPVVTKRPSSPTATGAGDAMTVEQQSELKRLAKQVGKSADALSQKFLEEDFDDLSIEGAAYMKYRIERKIKKAREENPNAFPAIDEAPPKPKAVPKDEDDDDDDDWKPEEAPKKKAASDDDDDDDDDWGDTKLKDKDGNILF